MACIGNLKLDLTKANEGIWFRWMEDVEFLVARTNNPAYNAALADLVGTYMIKHGDKEITEEQNELLVKHAFAIGCVKDWRNVTDEDDKPMVYDPEKMFEYLGDPDHELLWEFLWSRGSRAAYYLIEMKKKAVGN